MKESYRQMKDRHQAEVNALPLAFAFSREQYRRKLAQWGITEEEAEAGAVIGIGGGGFIRSSDREIVFGTLDRIQDETDAAIAADTTGEGFVYEMFFYELNNHEFRYTHSAEETLDALSITEEELQNSEALRHGLNKAIAAINAGPDPFGE